MTCVIVNSTTTGLDLSSGPLSQSILDAGGDSLQTQASEDYPYGITEDEIAVTDGGDLPCDEVYHVALPDWSDHGSAEEHLREVIEKCLRKADEDHSSIAFPSLGTGCLGYPEDTVASVFLDVMDDFSSSEPDNLTLVHIVLYPGNTNVIEAFKSAVRNVFTFDLEINVDLDSDDPVVQIVYGDITKQQTDVIVNSTTPSLNLSSGPLTNAILKAGGDTLEEECKRDYPNGIKEDEIAVTSGGDLSCEAVYHTTSCQYGPGAEEKLCKLILSCLQEADGYRYESISFPALGTGVLKYPPDIVAKCFSETATSFQGNSLSEIYIVVQKKDKNVVEAFKKEMERCSSEQTGDICRVSVVKGDITQQDVDVIVNSTTPDLNLSSGPVSQAILKAGGQSIQDECESKYPSGIKVGDIVETSGGNMPCQNVYHTTLINTDDDAKAEKVLFRLMKNCLTLAASQGKRSIAFPVLGTGRLTYARDMVAKCVFKSFDDFSFSNVDTSLTEARIVVHPKDVENLMVFGELSAARAAPGQSAIFTSFEPTDRTCIAQAATGNVREVQTPNYWSKTSELNDTDPVQLNPGQKEYQIVAQKFAKGTSTKYTIVKIERIQNYSLYRQYQVQAEVIGKRNSGHKAERQLWHGTSGDSVIGINTYGFSRSYTGKNATVYGEGSYFAVCPSYSAKSMYSPPDSDGNRRMYQASVLTGHYTRGASGIRVPPVRKKHIKYDTVVDDPNNPAIFVVFNDVQAYPKYLVTFK